MARGSAARFYLIHLQLNSGVIRQHTSGYEWEGARQVLRRLESRPVAWGEEAQRAFTNLGVGDTANALSSLERTTDTKEIWPLTMEESNPALDPMRASARFRKLLERVGLAEYPVARAR